MLAINYNIKNWKNSMIVAQIANTKFGQLVRKSFLGNILKNSRFLEYIDKTAGNWRYPFLSFGWMLASYFTRRRVVKINGIKFTLPCNNWITHFRWFLFGKKEIEVRNYIDKYVKDGDVFFDIGANIGVFSVYAAKKYPKLNLFCFEPEYSNLGLLKENILENKIGDRANLYSIGISDFKGLSHLHLQDTSKGAAAHTESKEVISKTDEGYKVVWKEGIATTTLDDFCDDAKVVPNCIKIDTDGNELKILNGAKNILKNKDLRSLVIEMPHTQGEKGSHCEKILTANGFKLGWSKKDKTLNEVWVRA